MLTRRQEEPRPGEKLGEDVGIVTAIAETPKALLVRRASDGEETWFPKSAITRESEVKQNGDHGILIVERWVAEKNEWKDRGPTVVKARRR
jgi:hypothetical protein